MATPPRKNVWLYLREKEIEAGRLDPTKTTPVFDLRDYSELPAPVTTPVIAPPTPPAPQERSYPLSQVGATKKKALSFKQWVGAPVSVLSRNQLKQQQQAQEEQRTRGLAVLQSARDQGLIPESIYRVLPAISVPRPGLLKESMVLEGQVERLLRAYRGVCYRRFRKSAPIKGTAKSLLKSLRYGNLLTQAAAVLRESQIAPIPWVDWATKLYAEKNYKGKLEWAKMPPLEWVYAPQVILPWRHSFRDSNLHLYELRYSGPIEARLVEQAMAIEKRLATFDSIDSLLAFWRSTELGQQWDSLLAAAKQEQFQQKQEWERKLLLGEWISEWP